MPGRTYTAGSNYRYGFNGKEKDNEVHGEGNAYDFGSRIYDPRISEWLSVDPLQKKYPGESPYLFTGGNPILFKDLDGKDKIETIVFKLGNEQYTFQRVIKDVFVTKLTSSHPEKQLLTFDRQDINETLIIDLNKKGQEKMITYSYNLSFNKNQTASEIIGNGLENILKSGEGGYPSWRVAFGIRRIKRRSHKSKIYKPS